MSKDKWVWMPHAAHFVGANSCGFVLATYVGKYIVSTVGDYTPRNSSEVEEIGIGRKYETMVFRGRRSREAGHCKACPWFIDSGSQKDFKGYNTAKAAFEGHMKLCRKWAARGITESEKTRRVVGADANPNEKETK